MKTCFLYPGQGVQKRGMGLGLWENSQIVVDFFRRADDLLGMDCEKLLFEAGQDELNLNDNTQVSITLVSIATRMVLADLGVVSDGCAGFSLGEFAAFADAGVISDDDALLIVKKRGELMRQAGEKVADPHCSAMRAVVGLEHDKIARVIADKKDVFLANFNSPRQIVLSGRPEALDEAAEELKGAGAKRVLPLPVTVPCHTPLLAEAQQALAEFLQTITFNEPEKIIYSNVSGKAINSSAEARDLSIKQLASPVLWYEEEQALIADGYERYIEAGCGGVLSRLWGESGSDIKAISCASYDLIKKAFA